MDTPPFWRAKTLEQMTPAEWESLCDGCGRCCLHKLRDDETGEIAFTDVACHLLDGHSCRCRDYASRQRRVPDCIALSPADLAEIDWLPPSCAYRLVAERRDLPWWHPLVSGDPDTVHAGGASVRGRVISERRAGALEDHVVAWPGRLPRRRGPATTVRRQGASPAAALPDPTQPPVLTIVPPAATSAATERAPAARPSPERRRPPRSGEPRSGEPRAGEPSAGEPRAGEPRAGEPRTGEPRAGEPQAVEPGVSGPGPIELRASGRRPSGPGRSSPE